MRRAIDSITADT